MKIAVIPARGGSKRIPGKNAREFQGQPMISWSIEAALASKLFDQVIVSTDDDEIAKIARQYGAITPFKRPAKLSDDFTGVIPVIAHACKAIGAPIDFVCTIYATAPFIQVEALKRGYDALNASPDHDYAVAVTGFGYPVQRALKCVETEHGTGLAMMYPQFCQTRSQDLQQAYHDAGQFFWSRPQALYTDQPIFSERSIPILIDPRLVQDIDTLADWRNAELIFSILKRSKSHF